MGRGRLAVRDEPGGNLRDLERHAHDLARRRGFTYTVLSTTGEVIGCIYIYPPRGESPGHPSTGEERTAVRSWVRADRAALDPVWAAIRSPHRSPCSARAELKIVNW
jgi:hypothetical protein